MKELSDLYYEMGEAKTQKKKYKCSLEIVKYFCNKGDMNQAQQANSILAKHQAENLGLTDEEFKKDTEHILRTGYKNAVPKIINEIGEILNSDESKNFRFIEYKIREAWNYAVESKSYSQAQMEKLEGILTTLRSWMLDAKARTPLEKIIDLRTITGDNEKDGYY